MNQRIGLLSIGELERLSGTPRHAIHRYVRSGLLPKPLKTSKTMAYYSEAHLERLREIREIKGSAKVPLSFLSEILSKSAAAASTGDGDRQPVETEKPEQESALRRRQNIRSAALKVFLDKSLAQTRIRDITEAAGVSVGTFYLYYDNKIDLFVDAIEEFIQAAVASIRDEVMKENDFVQRMSMTAQLFAEGYLYYSGVMNQFRGIMVSNDQLFRDKFISLNKLIADPFVQEIRAATRNGLIRDVNPELMAWTTMGSLDFLSALATFGGNYTPAQIASFMVDLLMRGLSKTQEA